MKKIIAIMVAVLICVIAVIAVLLYDRSVDRTKKKSEHLVIDNEKFTYHSEVLNAPAEYTFSYNDKWFKSGAEKYSNNIARISIRVAIAAADTEPDNIKKMFKALEFSSDCAYVDYPDPKKDTIGYIISHKQIDDVTLVACALRGGRYDAEWSDNFNIGTQGNHLGFDTQAKKVNKAVNAYIKKNNIDKDKLKIWITGFSRGAITSNITAHYLSEKYGNSNVFAYCFECPLGVDEKNLTSVDKNIFNIINDIDFITYLAPVGWNFGRYGITCYVPSAASSEDYESLKEAMSEQYGKIYSMAKKQPEAKKIEPYDSPEISGQARLIRSVFKSISKSMTRKEAEEKLFSDVRKTIEAYYDQGRIKIYADKLVVECVTKMIKSIGIEAVALFVKTGLDFDEFLAAVTETKYAHYPELCMAWVDTANSLIKEDDSTYLMTVK